MKILRSAVFSPRYVVLFRLGTLLVCLLGSWPQFLQAQQTNPSTGSGIANPASVATPVIDLYRALRTPTIKLTLAAPAKGSIAAKLASLTTLASGGDALPTDGLLQPQSRNGVFDEINLGYLDGSGKAPAPVVVSLQFDVSRVGTSVWIQPLDGGTIFIQDANGKPVSVPGGSAVVLDGSGQAVFSYQTLALPGRYQVLIRLGAVSSFLPFVVSDPSQDN